MWRYRATCISVARTCAARASLDTKCCPDAVDIHVTVCQNTIKPTNAHQQALQLMQVESRARCTQQFTSGVTPTRARVGRPTGHWWTLHTHSLKAE
jgi:hypothetical protein